MFKRKGILILIMIVLFLFSFYYGMYITSIGGINSNIYEIFFSS
jgi:hypothetical protein